MAQPAKQNIDPGAIAQVSRTFQLVWRLLNDPRVPGLPKLIIPLIIVYIVSPIELVPIFGQMSDLAVIFLGISLFIAMCPADIVMEHRRAIAGTAGDARDDYVDATYRVVDDDNK